MRLLNTFIVNGYDELYGYWKSIVPNILQSSALGQEETLTNLPHAVFNSCESQCSPFSEAGGEHKHEARSNPKGGRM